MTPLTVFFPGLGADSTLAKYHQTPGESLWIEWPPEIPDDWDDFARLLVRQIPANRPLRFVGISFGGLAALNVAQTMPPEGGVFLIGSLTDRADLRPLLGLALVLVRWIPSPLFDLKLLPRWVVSHFFGIRQKTHLDDFALMASRLPPRSVKALCSLVARWKPGSTPVSGRIHGRRDRILKPRSDSLRWVDGGHLISMTHPDEVGAWLRPVPGRP